VVLMEEFDDPEDMEYKLAVSRRSTLRLQKADMERTAAKAVKTASQAWAGRCPNGLGEEAVLDEAPGNNAICSQWGRPNRGRPSRNSRLLTRSISTTGSSVWNKQRRKKLRARCSGTNARQ